MSCTPSGLVRSRNAVWSLCWGILLLGGCAAGPTNPSLPLSIPQATEALNQMAESPKPLARPVVVVGGWMDPGIAAPQIAERLRLATGDGRIISVSVGIYPTFGVARQHLIAAVDEAFPSADPLYTTEVDVVGYSMGGIVARYAASALPADGPSPIRRLRVCRMFTISSPHRGSVLADSLPALSRVHADLQGDSSFLKALNAQPIPYPLYPYVRLGDQMVGAANAAPEGVTPWWVSNEGLDDAHGDARSDPRILADIARRVRHEHPFATTPPAPLPAAN